MTQPRNRPKPGVSPPPLTSSSAHIAALEAPRLPSFDAEPEDFDSFPPEEAPTATVSKPMLALLVRETLPRQPGSDIDSEPELGPPPISPEPLVIIRTQPPANPYGALQSQVTEPPTRPRLQPAVGVAPARPSAHPLLWVSLFVLAAAALAGLFWANLG